MTSVGSYAGQSTDQGRNPAGMVSVISVKDLSWYLDGFRSRQMAALFGRAALEVGEGGDAVPGLPSWRAGPGLAGRADTAGHVRVRRAGRRSPPGSWGQAAGSHSVVAAV
ncbi:hypothetical protein GCM10010321_89170 [Streptomyces chartreusis]|nr:hypothetical protein GCM10010321_89170 [Streptomyces chartreusis]